MHIKTMKGIYMKLFVCAIFFVVSLASGAINVIADDMAKDSVLPDIDHAMPLIVYIGTNEYPVENADAAARAGVTLATYNLDARRNLEQMMMAGLPTSPDESNLDIDALQAIVEQRFNALSQDDLKSIFQPVMLVQRWDIRKAPAFVFGNGQAVVYGLTDAEAMLEYWHEWQNTQKSAKGNLQ